MSGNAHSPGFPRLNAFAEESKGSQKPNKPRLRADHFFRRRSVKMGNADATQDPYVPQARIESALPHWEVSAPLHKNFIKVLGTPQKRACERVGNLGGNVSPVSGLPHPGHRIDICPPNYGARTHPCRRKLTCKLSVRDNPEVAKE